MKVILKQAGANWDISKPTKTLEDINYVVPKGSLCTVAGSVKAEKVNKISYKFFKLCSTGFFLL